MNCKTWTRIIALTLLAALAIPVSLAAQDRTQPQHQGLRDRLRGPMFGRQNRFGSSVPR